MYSKSVLKRLSTQQPYVVLATYKPKRWKCWRIGRYLTALTSRLGFKPLDDPIHGPQLWTPWCDVDLHAEVKKLSPKNPKGED